jgi:hypothetical protein
VADGAAESRKFPFSVGCLVICFHISQHSGVGDVGEELLVGW